MFFKKNRGFTLIELIMVIAILSVLAAVALPRYVNLKYRANVAGLKGSLGGIRAAIAMYYASTATVLNAPCFPGSIAGDMFFDNVVPREPISNLNAVYRGVAINRLGGWMYFTAGGSVACNITYSGYNTY